MVEDQSVQATAPMGLAATDSALIGPEVCRYLGRQLDNALPGAEKIKGFRGQKVSIGSGGLRDER